MPRIVRAALLLGVLIKRGHWGTDRGLIKRAPRLLLASGLMAAAIYWVLSALFEQVQQRVERHFGRAHAR